jgi:hypothetical protein
MRWAAYTRQAGIAVSRGTQYLLAHQDRAGLWHDYSLPPGPSDAWSTAWVGWSLAAAEGPATGARWHAATALLALRQCDGWGTTGAPALMRTAPHGSSGFWPAWAPSTMRGFTPALRVTWTPSVTRIPFPGCPVPGVQPTPMSLRRSGSLCSRWRRPRRVCCGFAGQSCPRVRPTAAGGHFGGRLMPMPRRGLSPS